MFISTSTQNVIVFIGFLWHKCNERQRDFRDINCSFTVKEKCVNYFFTDVWMQTSGNDTHGCKSFCAFPGGS